MNTKRQMIAAALFLLCLPFAHAQPKILRIVVPYVPGGSPDNLARMIGESLQKTGNYSVVVENKAGAGGGIAANYVKSANPDGMTLLLGDSSTYSINPVIRKSVSYAPLKDFKPVSLAATSPIYLVAHPKVGGTVKDFIAYLKAQPDQPMASSGTGTAHHLAIELIKYSTGAAITHVPYKGSSQTIPAVAAGDVIATFSGLTNATAFAQSGRVKILAIAEPKRSSMTPDIPTLAESGMPGYDVTISLGFLAPIGTPDNVVKALNEDIVKALNAPGIKAKLNNAGIEPATSTPAEFGQQIAKELAIFGQIAKRANITEE